MVNCIPISELKRGGVYRLHARNLLLGAWDGEQWLGVRDKFGLYLDSCEIPADDENPGTAYALKLLEMLPWHIPLVSGMGSFCQDCERPVAFDRERGETASERWYHTDESPKRFDTFEAMSPHDVKPYGKSNKALFYYLLSLEIGLRLRNEWP